MKTYLSFTTSPRRIKHIYDLLQDIDLTLFDEVLINLPEKFGRNGSEYIIPSKLKNMNKVNIIRIKKDKGPITKLMPALNYANNSNDIIISIDDDIKHNPSLFPLLIDLCKTKDVVVTGIGKKLSYWNSKKYGKLNRVEPFEYKPQKYHTDLVEGFSGVAYKKKFFPDLRLLNTLYRLSKDCYLSDDLVISFYLKLFGRRILSLSKMKKYGYHMLNGYSWGLNDNALHKGGGMNKNNLKSIDMNYVKYPKCYKTLVNYYVTNRENVDKLLLRQWHHDFDRICIINMKTRTNRRIQSEKILSTLNVPSSKITIVNATTPTNDYVKILNNIGINVKSMSDILGAKRLRDLKWHESKKNISEESKTYYKKYMVETAVSLSQIRVMKMAEKNNETILILEDDFGPLKEFYDVYAHKMHRQLDYDVLYLGDCSSMRSGSSKTVMSGPNNKLIQRHTVCHHAIAFRPSFSEKALHLKKNGLFPLDYPIDDQLGFYMSKRKIPFGIFNKPLMTQDVELGAMSNIQEKDKLLWELESSNKFQSMILKKI